MDAVFEFLSTTGFAALAGDPRPLVMLAAACILIYLAIAKKFEPLVLLPVAFGMLLGNLPGAGMYHAELFLSRGMDWPAFLAGAGLVDYLYLGVKFGIYPALIFLAAGASIDFSPLIARPKRFLLGAAVQLGVLVALIGAFMLSGAFAQTDFTLKEAAAIGMMGGAYIPATVYVASRLSPELFGPVALAAYLYMVLTRALQAPVAQLIATKREQAVTSEELRPVSKAARIAFPILATILVVLLLPPAAPLIGLLMLGNLLRECGVTGRLSGTAANGLSHIVTILIGISVGAGVTVDALFNLKALGILGIGLVAFGFNMISVLVAGKLLSALSRDRVNPLLGAPGDSAMRPMEGAPEIARHEKPNSPALIYAMGPNAAGVIASAITAGVFLALFAK